MEYYITELGSEEVEDDTDIVELLRQYGDSSEADVHWHRECAADEIEELRKQNRELLDLAAERAEKTLERKRKKNTNISLDVVQAVRDSILSLKEKCN